MGDAERDEISALASEIGSLRRMLSTPARDPRSTTRFRIQSWFRRVVSRSRETSLERLWTFRKLVFYGESRGDRARVRVNSPSFPKYRVLDRKPRYYEWRTMFFILDAGGCARRRHQAERGATELGRDRHRSRATSNDRSDVRFLLVFLEWLRQCRALDGRKCSGKPRDLCESFGPSMIRART